MIAVHCLLQLATVLGTVVAEPSLEPVPFALVEIQELGRHVIADAEGYFAISQVPEGDWELAVSAPGFGTSRSPVSVPATGAVRVQIRMGPAPIPLAGVTARAAASRGEHEVAGPRPSGVSAAMIDRLPQLGEADVFRAVQALPAVAAASDYSTAFYVRGGSPDQNLVLLDGAPLFNPYHLGGVFAALDPDAIAAVRVWPGAFPAGVGDRLSSVVEVWTRDGGRDRVRSHGGIGLVSSRLGVDGPLPGGSGSYLISARRTYLDWVTGVAESVGLVESALPYAFTDAHAKLTQDFGRNARVTASGYVDAESIGDPETIGLGEGGDLSWGTRVGSVAFRYGFGTNLLNARLAYSSFEAKGLVTSEVPDGTETVGLDGIGRMSDALAGLDLTRVTRFHELRTGFQYDHYRFRYRIATPDRELRRFVPPLDTHEEMGTLAAYIEDEWRIAQGVRARFGVRGLKAAGRDLVWLPRAGLAVETGGGFTASLGVGRSAQFLRTLRNEEAYFSSLFAYDLLLSTRAASAAPTALDAVGSLGWSGEGVRVRGDVYWRRYEDLSLAPIPPQPLTAPILTDSMLVGHGAASGLELSAARVRAPWNLRVWYALGFARRTVNGVSFTPRYHRLHRGSAEVGREFGGAGLMTLRLTAASGQPYTPVEGVHYALVGRPPGVRFGSGTRVLLLGDHNSARLPGYVRLDMAVQTEIERRWWGRTVRLKPFLSVLNVLGNRNVVWAEPQAFGERPRLDFAPQLPIVPSVGIEWQF